MITIYFPFSDVSETIARRLAACFQQTLVVRPCSGSASDPLARGEAAGELKVVVPAGGDEQRLEALVADYHSWAGDRGGADLSFLKSVGGDTPFFEADSTSRIRMQIKGGGPDAASADEDALFGDRLFLCLAEEFDRRQHAIAADLDACVEKEQTMLTHLLGEDVQAPTPVHADGLVPTDDPGAFMTNRRLRAWCRLAAAAVPPETEGRPVLWLTSSRAVFEALLEIDDPAPTDGLSIRFPVGDGGPEDSLVRQLEAVVAAMAASEAPPEPPSAAGRSAFVIELAALSGKGAQTLSATPGGVDGNTAPIGRIVMGLLTESHLRQTQGR